jgi:hypothetical protein
MTGYREVDGESDLLTLTKGKKWGKTSTPDGLEKS